MKAITLKGKVAIVTGAASGIGRGIAQGLAEADADVVVADINLQAAESAAAEITRAPRSGSSSPDDSSSPAGAAELRRAGVAELRRAGPHSGTEGGGRGWPLHADVTEKRSVQKMVEAALREFGRLDILVNNAGIAPSFPLADFPEDKWDQTVAVNLKGYFLCAQAVARVLIRQGWGGSIVNISSKTGVRGSADNSAYNATKFGVIGLAQGWAQELAKYKIRVNSVLPGNVIRGSGIWSEEYIHARAQQAGILPEQVPEYYNRRVPLGRQCAPEDVANAVVYLVSDLASYITGCSHLVDGGQEMRA